MTENEFYKWAKEIGLKVTPDCSNGNFGEFYVIDLKRNRRIKRNMNQTTWYGHKIKILEWIEEK